MQFVTNLLNSRMSLHKICVKPRTHGITFSCCTKFLAATFPGAVWDGLDHMSGIISLALRNAASLMDCVSR
jgi:hypothetical protein